jgi:hypothetical protein
MSDFFPLAAHLAGLDPDMDETPENVEMVEVGLAEKFDLDDLVSFDLLIKELLPLIEIADSALTMRRYKGFAQDGVWLAKSDA